MPHEVMENIPHDPLEGSGCVAQTKRHPPECISTLVCYKRGVDLVAGPDVSLMIPGHPI